MKGFSMPEQFRVKQATSCLGLCGHDCLSFKGLGEIDGMRKRKTAARKPVKVCYVLCVGWAMCCLVVQRQNTPEHDHTMNCITMYSSCTVQF
jgi:hypothetical protein